MSCRSSDIRSYLLRAVIVSLFLFVRCNKEEPIPSYIHIDTINLTTVYANEGTNSNKIVDAWIYLDDQLVGAFEMPFTIPVLYEGTHTIKVAAGIKNNGIANTRIAYPFYAKFEQSITLTRGAITTVNPSVAYSQGITFTWMEDFEGTAPSICDTINSDTTMQIIKAPDPVFQGVGSGGIFLGNGRSVYTGETCNKYVFPKSSPIFLELNYYCNIDFNVGIDAYDQAGSSIGKETIIAIHSNSEWNKIYIDLGSRIASYTTAAKFGITFSTQSSAPSSFVYLDNIKLMYY